MSNQFRLVGVGNSELLAGLSALVRQSNVLTGRLLAQLVELEERKLHLELGFSSLFAYCVEALRMSEGTAGRRVTAARVCRRFPEVFERVARGDLHLCALCALAPHLNAENSAEFFAACHGKTRRQVEELLAARFPRPDVREQVRRLPARATLTAVPSEPNVLSARASDASALATNPLQTAAISPNAVAIPAVPAVPAERAAVRRRARELEPLSPDRFGVHFTADAELRELIERARALASHQLPNGDLAGLVKLMAARFVRQEEKRRFGIGARKRRVKTGTSAASSSAGKDTAPPGEVAAAPEATEPAECETRALTVGNRGRYVPMNVRRETHMRDRGRCAFVSADGRRCTARAFLELDHRKLFAKHGGADALNIRLLCRARAGRCRALQGAAGRTNLLNSRILELIDTAPARCWLPRHRREKALSVDGDRDRIKSWGRPIVLSSRVRLSPNTRTQWVRSLCDRGSRFTSKSARPRLLNLRAALRWEQPAIGGATLDCERPLPGSSIGTGKATGA